MSIVIHEVSHGYAALWLGDKTALYEGRLTLNPIKHIDIFGSLIVPFISITLGGIVFGWAKPVPFNPYNFTKMKAKGEAFVAFAGPLSNILLAFIFGLYIRFAGLDPASPAFQISAMIVFTNLILALFNLMPIPPLDGSKILGVILPPRYQFIRQKIESFGFVAVILFSLLLWQFVTPVIDILFKVFTGYGM